MANHIIPKYRSVEALTGSIEQWEFVDLQIRTKALQKLIRSGGLSAEDLHCGNKQTKRVVFQALISGLKDDY